MNINLTFIIFSALLAVGLAIASPAPPLGSGSSSFGHRCCSYGFAYQFLVAPYLPPPSRLFSSPANLPEIQDPWSLISNCLSYFPCLFFSALPEVLFSFRRLLKIRKEFGRIGLSI